MSLNNDFTVRRCKAMVNTLGTTQLHLRNPLIVAVWSAMFPGFGHLLLSKYLRGFLLFIWEVFININGHINLGILYSFTGQFERAKNILDTKWILLYVPTFFYSIWDSYRTTVDLNNQYILASREDTPVKPFKISAWEINYLDRKSPWSSVLWSCLMPGIGQLSIHRVIPAFFIFAWWIAIMYFSNFLPSLHNTFLGNFTETQAALDPQWALNIPSIFSFSVYSAYVNTVESNKLFEWEQSKFLKANYQDHSFQIPLKKNTGSGFMHIIATFEHSITLEKVITMLQMKGVAKEDILAVPLDVREKELIYFDTIRHSDGRSLLDLPFILGAFLALLGGIYGFIWVWGPIIWGLIGFATGFGIGFLIKLISRRGFGKNGFKKTAAEVVLIIRCREDLSDFARETLWAHNARGVRKMDL